MKKRTRPTFSPEFRLEASQLVVDQNYTVIAAAKAMNVGIPSPILILIFRSIFDKKKLVFRLYKSEPSSGQNKITSLKWDN